MTGAGWQYLVMVATLIFSLLVLLIRASSTQAMDMASSTTDSTTEHAPCRRLEVVIKRGGQEVCRKSLPETDSQVDAQEEEESDSQAHVIDPLDSIFHKDQPVSRLDSDTSSIFLMTQQAIEAEQQQQPCASPNDPKIAALLSKLSQHVGLSYTPTDPSNETELLWNLVDIIPQIDDCMAQQFPLGSTLDQACWSLRPVNPAAASDLSLMRNAMKDMMFVEDYERALEDALLTLQVEAESLLEFRQLRVTCRGHRNPLLKAINELRLLGGKYLKVFTDDPRYRFKSTIDMKDVRVLTGCDMQANGCFVLLARMHGLKCAESQIDSSKFRGILNVTNKALCKLRRQQRVWLFQ